MDSTAWTIIGGMGTAIVALSGFITKLYADLKAARADLKACQEARIAQAEEHFREMLALRDIVRAKKKGGQR